jgi:hypothetical protein
MFLPLEDKLLIMSKEKEILQVGKDLGITCTLLREAEALEFIKRVLEKYKPFKTTGHLSIGKNSISISLEEHEFTYSAKLNDEAVFIFFDQESTDRKKVVMVENGRNICRIMESSFGMEYFVSNKNADYLIAVNWYAIEIAGTAKEKFQEEDMREE